MNSLPPISGVCQRVNLERPVLIEIDQQGELLKIKQPQRYPTRSPAQSKRGVITGFSAKSRKRLLELMARFDRRKLHKQPHKCLFITLTWQENMTDVKRGKMALRAFIRRLERHADGVWGVWRQERQERGALHYHLIIGGLPFTNVTTLQSWWSTITGEHNVKNSLDLEIIRSYNGVMFYTSKYVAKLPEQSPEPVGLSVCHNGTESPSEGRQWGTFNRSAMPLARRIKHTVVTTLGTLLKWAESCPSDYANGWEGCTIMSEAAASHLMHLVSTAQASPIDNERAIRTWRRSLSWWLKDDFQGFTRAYERVAKQTLHERLDWLGVRV